MEMSNDLISRKLVYADDIHRYIKAEINPYGKPFEGSAYEFGLKIMEYIENMNVAYDVTRVVEQLEEYLFERYCVEGDSKIDEIIKEGGVSDNH